MAVGSSHRVRGSPTRLDVRECGGAARASASKSAGAVGCGYDHRREPQPRSRWRPDLHGGECRRRNMWPAGRMGCPQRPHLLNGGFAAMHRPCRGCEPNRVPDTAYNSGRVRRRRIGDLTSRQDQGWLQYPLSARATAVKSSLAVNGLAKIARTAGQRCAAAKTEASPDINGSSSTTIQDHRVKPQTIARLLGRTSQFFVRPELSSAPSPPRARWRAPSRAGRRTH